ncbi:hypothetical protein MTYP_02237 [Methylophilaceae bacterium]|nr:hypothetical protein MTYP_02237 [Methylophilaceae bacterium]
MRITLSVFAVKMLALAVLTSLQLAQAADKKVAETPLPWVPAKLPDGQPDVRGFWGAKYSGTYSLVNAGENGQAGWPGKDGSIIPRGPDGKIPIREKRPSRIIDPADGQVPYLPWARAKQQDLLDHFENPIKPGYVEGLARCFPGGVSRQQFGSVEIRQYPGYVLLLSGLSNRIIPLNGRPHIPANIKLWMSDSRGHWEGNTLVVDVTSSNSKHRLSNQGDFASDKVHIRERFIFLDANTYRYEATYNDPSVFTRPWTLESPMRRTRLNEPNYEPEEYSCHEGDREFYALEPQS